MNIKTFALAAVLIDFIALTAWALSGTSFSALAELLSSPVGMQMTADVLILLTFANVWIYRDAKARGINPLPWIVLTCLTGSPGPLAYAIRRQLADARPAALPTAATSATTAS